LDVDVRIKSDQQSEWDKLVMAATVPDDSGLAISYKQTIVAYAVRWADLMEREIEHHGNKLADVALDTSVQAIDERYECEPSLQQHALAALALATCWEYGDEFRDWHNARWMRMLGSAAESQEIEKGTLIRPHEIDIGNNTTVVIGADYRLVARLTPAKYQAYVAGVETALSVAEQITTHQERARKAQNN
jgi:hypothetical protein